MASSNGIPDCGEFTSKECSLLGKKSALANSCREYTFYSPLGMFTGVDIIFDRTRLCLEQILNTSIEQQVPVKAHATIECVFYKMMSFTDEGAEPQAITSYFSSKAMPILNQDDMEEFFERNIETLSSMVEKFTQCGSSWILIECKTLTLRLVKYTPNSILSSSSKVTKSANDNATWHIYE